MQIKEAISEKKSSSLFKTPHRFLRSTHLERDWDDPFALENFNFTLHSKQSLNRIAAGLRTSSSLRAWRLTGDYGSGKSSFALLLANVFAKRLKNLSPSLKAAIHESVPELLIPSQPQLLPILVTGSREPLGYAILKMLLRNLKEIKIHAGFYNKLNQVIQSRVISDEIVIDWLTRSHLHLIKTKKSDGIVIILDEAGKFLEFAAMQPTNQDIHLLQSLAEVASRSGKHPFFVLPIFHQGIFTYSESLSKAQQREWEKVAGRFEEIIWHYPVEQNAMLISSSLGTNLTKVPKSMLSKMKDDMKKTLQMGWYGININKTSLNLVAQTLYPIHPTVIPILVKLFSKFGQNERSLFSFLLGAEPFGLQEFVTRTAGKEIYHLHNLYDYARSTFGSRLASLSYHWKAIDSVVGSFVEEKELSLHILKTIGIINLINSDDLVASHEILNLATGGFINKELSKLQTSNKIHFRGKAGGFCVWPHTSVNLEDAYAAAKKALGNTRDFKSLLKERLEIRPIVARRHYIETGNLRFFEIKYVEVIDVQNALEIPLTADGLIIIPLCETLKDRQVATEFAKSVDPQIYPNVLIVIPPPLQELSTFLEEVRRWEWIERSIGELRQDRFAREEVSRQLSISQQQLQLHLKSSIGLRTINTKSNLVWYHLGKSVIGLNSGKDVMSLLTKICNNTYSLSPRIHNELINRRNLSSAGASARLRLCERLFEFSDQVFLGMDMEKHPPEMSMYLSVLKEAGLHKQIENSNYWNVVLPDTRYDERHCKVLPIMNHVKEILQKETDKRVPVSILFTSLRSAPYGVRDGVIPLFLAVFAVIHEKELAFYEDGSFIPRITGSSYLRLIKAPETFEVQFYPITAVRTTLFRRLVDELNLSSVKKEKVDILDVVKPLLVFISGLPEYVLKTSNLTPETKAVRALLTTSLDPIELIFHNLPKIFGLQSISERINTNSNDVKTFVGKLKSSVDELRGAYPDLLEQIKKNILKEFMLEGGLEKNRSRLAERAKFISAYVTEIGLKAFCLRLVDQKLAEDLWVESLGNLLASMPPGKWRDKDYYKFEQEIHKLTNQFLRVEATLFKHIEKSENSISVRVALTKPNGEERDQVIQLTIEEVKKMLKLQEKIMDLLANHGQIGMAAASEVIWTMMNKD